MPGTLYLGQKDYQQCMVIQKLLSLLEWQDRIQLEICPTTREGDGLAMSSRNRLLSADARMQAVRISETLLYIRNQLKPGYLADLEKRCSNYLESEGFKVDYVAIAGATDLSLQETWDGQKPMVALIAAFLGEVRLIDNMLVGQGDRLMPFLPQQE